MNHLDFLTFQLNVFSSLSPHAPLEENLRALMAPALSKICKHCRAEAVFHIFENVAMKELHALAIDKDATVSEALRNELKRRSGCAGPHAQPLELPKYQRIEHATEHALFCADRREYKRKMTRPEASALKTIVRDCGIAANPNYGDWIIVVPLGNHDYPRLGAAIAWAPGDKLESQYDDLELREGLVLFRLYVQRLLISLFSNYYDMKQETYLPSYQSSGVKAVTLLCAQIRSFERLCQIINSRTDFTQEKKSDCLRSLINGFMETTSHIVEVVGGRIDQLWGSGLVAVFGEYLHKPQIVAAPGCQEALEAAAEIVESLDRQAAAWLDKHFHIDDYKKLNIDQVDVQAAIAIDHSEVLFDYVGGERHRVFMAIGDRVNFVKQLSTAIGPACREGEVGCGPPILLSQSAHAQSCHILQDRLKDQAGAVHLPTMINLADLPRAIPVFPIWPENVARKAR